MEMQSTSSVLFCGMGSHARSVPIFIRQFGLRTIYIVYSQYNLPEYETKIAHLKHDIEETKGLTMIHFVQINEHNIIESFQKIISLYKFHLQDQFYTDLTAGHKIISYLLWYAHTFMATQMKHVPIVCYLWENSDIPIQLPHILPQLPDISRIKFLQHIKRYLSQSNVKMIDSNPINPFEDAAPKKRKPIVTKKTTLSAFLVDHNYSRVQITRYRDELIAKRYLTENNDITITGEFLISTL